LIFYREQTERREEMSTKNSYTKEEIDAIQPSNSPLSKSVIKLLNRPDIKKCLDELLEIEYEIDEEREEQLRNENNRLLEEFEQRFSKAA